IRARNVTGVQTCALPTYPHRHRTGGPGVAESPYNYRWIVDNRTKRGLALDLREPAGRAVLHRLVARADVFVTDTPLDSRAKLGKIGRASGRESGEVAGVA